jgi:hypothetical protein
VRLEGLNVDSRSFENVAKLKYLVTIATNQNLIQEDNKRRLNSGNCCYRSVFSYSVKKRKN